jgi:hypothetical protein
VEGKNKVLYFFIFLLVFVEGKTKEFVVLYQHVSVTVPKILTAGQFSHVKLLLSDK